MVNNNNNLPPIEEIREIKNEIPSFEEFMRNYKSDELVEDSYINEVNGCDNLGTKKGYGPCSYSSYKINGRYIDVCGDSDCVYYREMNARDLIINTDNAIKESFGFGVATGAGIGFWGSVAIAPITGGASLIPAVACSVASAIASSTINESHDALKRIENELKSRWEEEQRAEEREKTRKINSLKGQLDEAKRELEEAIESMDMCKSDNDYMREKNEKERLESKVRNLKRELCREKDCNCGGYCL